MALGKGGEDILIQRPSQSVAGTVAAHVANIEGLIPLGGCRGRGLAGGINVILTAGTGDIGHYLGPAVLLGIRCTANGKKRKNKNRYLFHIQR